MEAKRRQDWGDDREVVPRVPEARPRPGGAHRFDPQIRRDLPTQLLEAPDEEDDVDGVQHERPRREEPFDRVVSTEHEPTHAEHDRDHPDPVVQSERVPHDRARRRRNDRQHQEQESDIAHLEEPPSSSEEPLEEVAVVEGLPHAGELERRH